MSTSAWIYSQLHKNCSKITQYLNNEIAAASDHAALRVLLMQWRLEVILPTVQHKECIYGYWDSLQQELS